MYVKKWPFKGNTGKTQKLKQPLFYNFQTSECVTLEFLTYEDLQQLRANCLRTHSSRCLRTIKASDRKYLIVNYNVEFDRWIFYILSKHITNFWFF